MRVLILSAKDDNGGIGIAIKRAFDKHSTDVEVRSVTRHGNWIGWESDLVLTRDTAHEAKALFDAADVIHIMDVFAAAEGFSGYDKKPKVFHHHGHDFRQHAKALMFRCRTEGIPQIAATIDLLKYGDDISYLPNPCDIDKMQRYRELYLDQNDRPLVVQTPTSLEANGTYAFREGFKRVADRADLGIIRNLPWDECMRRKARADIVFDSFVVAYGLTSIEAWGMGLPVIHGSSDEWVEDKTVELLGFTPYFYANPDTIGDALEAMVDDEELRAEYAEKGWATVNEHHSEEALVRNLTTVYERAMA